MYKIYIAGATPPRGCSSDSVRRAESNGTNFNPKGLISSKLYKPVQNRNMRQGKSNTWNIRQSTNQMTILIGYTSLLTQNAYSKYNEGFYLKWDLIILYPKIILSKWSLANLKCIDERYIDPCYTQNEKLTKCKKGEPGYRWMGWDGMEWDWVEGV